MVMIIVAEIKIDIAFLKTQSPFLFKDDASFFGKSIFILIVPLLF